MVIDLLLGVRFPQKEINRLPAGSCGSENQ